MANVGLRHVVVAPIKTHTSGSPITYDTGSVIGMATQADVTINRGSNVLYADDVEAERDDTMQSATITVAVDDLPLAKEALLSNLAKADEESNGYDDTDDAPPLVGMGYVRIRRKTNQETGVVKKSYIGNWWYRTRPAISSESQKSKGANMEFATSSVAFNAQGAEISNDGKMHFRRREEFDTYAAAEKFVDDFANISHGG